MKGPVNSTEIVKTEYKVFVCGQAVVLFDKSLYKITHPPFLSTKKTAGTPQNYQVWGKNEPLLGNTLTTTLRFSLFGFCPLGEDIGVVPESVRQRWDLKLEVDRSVSMIIILLIKFGPSSSSLLLSECHHRRVTHKDIVLRPIRKDSGSRESRNR